MISANAASIAVPNVAVRDDRSCEYVRCEEHSAVATLRGTAPQFVTIRFVAQPAVVIAWRQDERHAAFYAAKRRHGTRAHRYWLPERPLLPEL